MLYPIEITHPSVAQDLCGELGGTKRKVRSSDLGEWLLPWKFLWTDQTLRPAAKTRIDNDLLSWRSLRFPMQKTALRIQSTPYHMGLRFTVVLATWRGQRTGHPHIYFLPPFLFLHPWWRWNLFFSVSK
jgi:hypothetical protein